MSAHAPGPLVRRRFSIISIALRRQAGDHAYRCRESFVATLDEACKRHVAFGEERPSGVRCSVLRDGLTGTRYSLADSQEIHRAASFEAAHLAKLAAIAKATGSTHV